MLSRISIGVLSHIAIMYGVMVNVHIRPMMKIMVGSISEVSN